MCAAAAATGMLRELAAAATLGIRDEGTARLSPHSPTASLVFMSAEPIRGAAFGVWVQGSRSRTAVSYLPTPHPFPSRPP